MNFIIEPAESMYLAMQKRLDDFGKGNKINEILIKAINETAVWTKDRTHEETRGMYTIKGGSFKKSDLKLKRASKTRLWAVIKVTGYALSLKKAYKYRSNTKVKAARALIKSNGAMKDLELKADGKSYKAFLATMASGHDGIFQRVPGKRMKNRPQKEAIKEIMALSRAKAAEMAYIKNVDPDKNEIYYRLHKHMNAIIGG